MNQETTQMKRAGDRREGGGRDRRITVAQQLVEDELTIKQALNAIGIDKDRRLGSRRSGKERRD